ncbi:hypothetical protein J3458_020617 [Metarhizium acridum]|uniref:uncharacterized protein n=1 Tax=Metarhizium acridum TaxID=92637 RepID=UPI001C6AA5A9|nr:hypothetical protein J3458_020617 [Metarhizium acridum]
MKQTKSVILQPRNHLRSIKAMDRFRRKIPPQVPDASRHVNARTRAIHLAISPPLAIYSDRRTRQQSSPVGITKRPTPQLDALNPEPTARGSQQKSQTGSEIINRPHRSAVHTRRRR